MGTPVNIGVAEEELTIGFISHWLAHLKVSFEANNLLELLHIQYMTRWLFIHVKVFQTGTWADVYARAYKRWNGTICHWDISFPRSHGEM